MDSSTSNVVFKGALPWERCFWVRNLEITMVILKVESENLGEFNDV